ncbi:MAG: sialidase family protein [Gaiellaceae bacterium]
MHRRLTIAIVIAAAALVVAASATAGSPTFSNTVLRAPATLPAGFSSSPPNQSGDSEPAIDFGGPSNTMAVDGLGWLPFQVNLWKGHFGDTPPPYFGAMDTLLPIQGAGRVNLGDGDADVEVTSAGTILLADLDIIFNPRFNTAQLGVSVTRCPATAIGPSGCTSKVLDTAGADREWITTAGTSAWLSYHDSKNSSLISVWRSSDDGQTWTKVSSPIPGQGRVTGDATFNNSLGPIVADPTSGNVYQPFAAGEPSVQKGTSSAFNNVFVARSTDGGSTWTTHLVYHAPLFTNLANFWPTLAVDPSNGALYAAWTDRHGVWVSSSTDHGSSWSLPLKVSTVTTTVMPWLAALNGKVDVVYYGTNASSTDDPTAVWNTYDSQFQNGSWSVGLVSNTPNRVGVVCLNGSACRSNRELLDLFEVAEDPASNKAAVIYTDTTVDTWTGPDGVTHQLPEIVLAYEQ